MRLAVVAIVFFGSGVSAAHAAPDACTSTDRPIIVVRTVDLDGALRAEFTDHLRAALAARGLALCEGAADRPIATVDVQRSESAVNVTVIVHDDVKSKLVAREVDTKAIAPDARALSLAQAADELLRASRAEVPSDGAPKPAQVPPDTEQGSPPTAAPSAPETPARVVEIGAGIAGEAFTGGYAQLGPDLSIAFFPWPKLGAVMRGGLRSGGSADSSFGTARASSVLGSAAVVVRVVSRDGLGLDAGADLTVMRVAFEGEPTSGAIGKDGAGIAACAAALVRGWVVIAAPLRLTLAMSTGAPLRTVRAVAPGETVVAVNGLLIGGQLLLGAAW